MHLFQHMSEWLDTLLTGISDNFWLSMLFIFLVSLGECVFVLGLFVPSTPVLLLTGSLMAVGKLPFWPIYLIAVLGAVVGDSISYGVGRLLEHRVKDIWPFVNYRDQIANLLADQQFKQWQMPFNSDSAFWSDVGYELGGDRLSTTDDYKKYLDKLGQIPRYFDQQIDNMRAGLARGFSVPRAVLDGRDRSIKSVAELTDPTQSSFYKPFRQMPGGISASDQDEMRARAADRVAASPLDIEFLDLPGEEIPLDDEAADTVLVTYTLCTIPDVMRALSGMRRVLKPSGRLIFCEHGEAPDASVKRWQDRIEPVWKKICGGCHLTRPVPHLIETGGFAVETLETMYLPGTPRFAGFNYWGSARKG